MPQCFDSVLHDARYYAIVVIGDETGPYRGYTYISLFLSLFKLSVAI